METIDMLNVLIGVVATFVVSLITKPSTTARMRVLLVIAVTVPAGYLSALYSNQLDATDIGKSIITVLFTATLVYTQFLKPTIGDKLEALSIASLNPLKKSDYKPRHLKK